MTTQTKTKEVTKIRDLDDIFRSLMWSTLVETHTMQDWRGLFDKYKSEIKSSILAKLVMKANEFKKDKTDVEKKLINDFLNSL